MDWGFGNPNKTAILLGMLMISVWLLSYIKKWGFWISLSSFVVLGICLMHTVSRGGLFATVAGGSCLLCNLPRPWNNGKTIAVVLGIVILFLSSLFMHTVSRYGQGLQGEDRSITNRLVLWQMAPRMMVDAPAGWGLGNAGRAYLQWYQPLNSHESYRTLVNSHLTWLVEFGWPLRFIYLLTWASTFLLCCPNAPGLARAVPLGIWMVFGTGAFFSSVAESIWLWVLPVFALACSIWWRLHCACWPKPKLCGIAIAGCAVVLLGLWITGTVGNTHDIRVVTNNILLGNAEPNVWIIVDTNVLGSDFGRIAREHRETDAIGLAMTQRLQNNIRGEMLVVCGRVSPMNLDTAATLASHFHRVLLVNPAFYPQEFRVSDTLPVDLLYGEFSTSSAISEWKKQLRRRAIIMPGVGDFVPDWPLRLLITPLTSTPNAEH